MFSKACECGIRATIYMATQSSSDIRLSLKDTVKKANSPNAFTAEILLPLTKIKIIESLNGPTEGFEINFSILDQIKESQIVSVIDGDEIFGGCNSGLSKCSEKQPYPVHHRFTEIRNELDLC